MQGVGFDYGAINGAMLIGLHGTLWGIRVCYFDGKKWLDNDDLNTRLGSGCANTQDGYFAHFASGPLSAKWVKQNEKSILLQVTARKKLRVRIIFYPCYKWPGELSIEGGNVLGRAPYTGIVPGSIHLTDTHAEFRDRYRVHFEGKDEMEYFVAKSYSKPVDSANGAFNEAIMEFIINKQQPSVYVYATISDTEQFDSMPPELSQVISKIQSAETRYGVDKTYGTGALGSATEKMLNSIHWARMYYPFLMQEIYSPKRTKLDNYFDIDGLEENCTALLGCFAGGVEYAKKQLKYTIGDKLFSVLAVWHMFCHSNDKKSLKSLYIELKERYAPNADLVATDNGVKTEVAYKWEDSPLKEKRDTAPMYSLDMSCIKLLALETVSKMASVYGENGSEYQNAWCELKKKINEVLWNEKLGLHTNRYVSLKWPGRGAVGATSFYVLICNAVDSSRKLSLIVNNLLHKKKFWTDYAVPTLIASSMEFGKRGKPNNNGLREPKYLQYRGAIIPYVNYIIYHGLVRYGLDDVAAKLALLSANLWQNNKSDNVENYSVYLPFGKRVKSKEYLSCNGNMLALIGVQELIDVEYYRDNPAVHALRFGTFCEGEHSVTNVNFYDKLYSIETSDLETSVLYLGKDMFHGEGGKFVVRHFVLSNTGCEFIIDAHANININLSIPSQVGKKTTKYFVLVPVGKSRVFAENGMVSITPIVHEDKSDKEMESSKEDEESGGIEPK